MRSSSVRAVDFHMQIRERSFCSIWDCCLGLVEDAAPPVGRMAAIMVKHQCSMKKMLHLTKSLDLI